MRECALCGNVCDASIGLARQLTSRYWGGRRNGNVEHSPEVVAFFCSESHRNDFLVSGATGGAVQTERWSSNGED